MILDLSKRGRLTVHPVLKAVSTFPLDQRQAEGARRERQSCDGGATAIKSARMGYEVVSQRPIRDIPNLPSHFPDVEVWVAPALGCKSMRASRSCFQTSIDLSGPARTKRVSTRGSKGNAIAHGKQLLGSASKKE
jgi:hypothetical protein